MRYLVGPISGNAQPHIQSVVDMAGPGDTIELRAGARYQLASPVQINKPLVIDGHGAIVDSIAQSWPEDYIFVLGAQQTGTKVQWTEAIAAGQATFATGSSAGFAIGDKVIVHLGDDPYDGDGLPHFSTRARVVATTPSSITLDVVTPFEIVQGANPHAIEKISTAADNTTIRNIELDHTGLLLDQAIWIDSCDNVTIENITGRWTSLVNASVSRNLLIHNIVGRCDPQHSAARRLLTTWHCEGVEVDRAMVSFGYGGLLAFFEGATRQVSVRNVVASNSSDQPLQMFHSAGDTRNFTGDNIIVRSVGSIAFLDHGAQPGDGIFGHVELVGPVGSFPIAKCRTLRYQGQLLQSPVTRLFSMAVPKNQGGQRTSLFTGFYRSCAVRISSKTGIQSMWFKNSTNGAGAEISGSLVPGQWLAMNSLIGSVYPGNDGSTQGIELYTDGSVPDGTTIDVMAEYYGA